jgi:hypothetical protein
VNTDVVIENDLVIAKSYDLSEISMNTANWMMNLVLDENGDSTNAFPLGVVDYMFLHGTFPRGYSDKESKFSKVDRDRNRAKSKIARKTARSTRFSDSTQH